MDLAWAALGLLHLRIFWACLASLHFSQYRRWLPISFLGRSVSRPGDHSTGMAITATLVRASRRLRQSMPSATRQQMTLGMWIA